MFLPRYIWLAVGIVGLVLGSIDAPSAWAQAAADKFELPQDPRVWINSPPWSVKQLTGKAVMLYFFEEECPRCRNRWPELNALKQQHADDPILFVAVNSGNSRGELEQYARQANVAWPILLDPDRSFEKACKVDEINLDNIMDVMILQANGSLKQGSWSKPDESVENALKDAKWTVDPKTIPPMLKSAWQQVEFQNYAATAQNIRKSLKSSNDDIKTAAEGLMRVVQPLIDEQVQTAETAYDAGEKWQAFRAYGELAERFKGYELPANMEARVKELQTDATVKAEQSAFRLLETIKKQLNNPAQRKKGILALKKLAKDKPDTAAGQAAQKLADELDAE